METQPNPLGDYTFTANPVLIRLRNLGRALLAVLVVGLILIITAVVQREAGLPMGLSLTGAFLVGLSTLVGFIYYTRHRPKGIVLSLSPARIGFHTWYGRNFEVPWTEVDYIQVRGDRWRFGPVSRFFYNGHLRLHTSRRIYTVDLACHTEPREVFEHIVDALVLAHPELATDGFREGALSQAADIVDVGLLRETLAEQDNTLTDRTIRRELATLCIVPLLTIFLGSFGLFAELHPVSSNPLTKLVLFGVLPVLWIRAYADRILRTLDIWVLARVAGPNA